MLTMKNIIRDDNPLLRVVCEEVNLPPSTEDKQVLLSLLEFVINSQDPTISKKLGLRAGIGLAAPQIGITKRMIAVHVIDDQEILHSYALFNPKIVSHSVELTYLKTGEGCLSVDRDIPGIVPRYSKIRVRGFNVDGELVDIRLKGLPSIVFQHEIDHLNGIMFYDHINRKDPLNAPEGAVPLDRK
ncbi:MAG: def [Bacillales bacterium]|nr:def [Bacillales bacterium]